MTNACGIQNPQGTIALGAPLLGIQRVVGRTAQRPIGLRRKSGTREAMGKGWAGPLGRSIHRRRSRAERRTLRWLARVNRLDGTSWSKFGRAQVGWGESLPQLHAEVPDPLGQD